MRLCELFDSATPEDSWRKKILLLAKMFHKFISPPREYDVIGIDEGQFFPDIVTWCEEMANRCSWRWKPNFKNVFRGKIVLVAALDGTFQRLPFPEMLALVPLAEAVTKLQAVCMICFQVERSKKT